MPLSTAAPTLQTNLNKAFSDSRTQFKSLTKTAFELGLMKFQDKLASGFSVGDAKSTINTAISEAAQVFSDEMDKAFNDSFKNLGGTIAAEVNTYVLSALITVPPGQVVVTAGTPAAQTGSTTTPTTAIIS